MAKRTTTKLAGDGEQIRLPKYRHHKATGQAVVWLGGRRDVYLGKHGTPESKREYQRLCAEWLASGRQAPPSPADGPLTVAALILRYWNHVKAQGNRANANRIKTALRPLRKLYGHTEAAKFGPLALKAVRAQLVRDELARSTINSYINIIRGMFKWGAGEELLPAEVWAKLRTVDGLKRGNGDVRETEPVGPVSDALVDATLPHLTTVVADMVRVQRLAGMRPGEVCGMSADQIDMSGKVWVYRPRRHKNAHRGHDRVVAIGPKAQAILRKYLDRPINAALFSPRESEAERGRDYQCAEAYTTSTYRQAIENACLRAKLDPWKPNQLRHAAATAIRKEYGIEAAGVTLGHKTLAVTDSYAERDMALAVKVAAAVG